MAKTSSEENIGYDGVPPQYSTIVCTTIRTVRIPYAIVNQALRHAAAEVAGELGTKQL